MAQNVSVAVVGAGGAGGYFGGRWVEAGLDVTLVARGAHGDAIEQHGLRILSPLGDVTVQTRVVNDPADLGPVDLVVLATKAWQLEEAAAAVAPRLGGGTMVLGLQNGVEVVDVLRRQVPASRVLGATCRIISLIEEPGVIRHVGAEPTVVFGEVEGGMSDRVGALATALDLGATLRAIASPEVMVEVWRKFLFFAPVSGVGSVTGAPFGAFRSVPQTRALLEAAVREVGQVAEASGIRLGEDAIARTIGFIDSLPPKGTSSMQRDFEAGRRTELDNLSGAVSRIGRSLGIPTPVHDHIYAALLPRELRARGELAW